MTLPILMFIIMIALIFCLVVVVRWPKKTLPDWVTIAVLVGFIVLIGYGIHLQDKNGFVSPYHFGERGAK